MTDGREERYDVVVVGGGAAGLSGALALARSRRRVLVVDAGAPRNAPADHVHNYLAREGMPPLELLATGRAEVGSYGGEVVSGTVTRAERLGGEGDPPEFRVELESGDPVRARRLLVTTGVVDELPDVPGVAERWGRDVLHCPYCHGWEVRDQAVGILATSALAMHQAQLWRQVTTDVTVFQHTAPPFGEAEREGLAARGVRLVEGEVAALEVSEDRLTGVRLRDGARFPLQALVVATRATVRQGLLTALGVEPAEMLMNGVVFGIHVPADPMGATSVPGVYVAGNVTDLGATVIAAAAGGMRAGAAINADLAAEDTRLAVAAHRSRGGVLAGAAAGAER